MMSKVAVAICALATLCVGLQVSPQDAGAELTQVSPSIRRLLAVHSDEARLAEGWNMDCSSILLPLADMRSVEACRSAMRSHQRNFYNLLGSITEMLSRQRNKVEEEKVNVVNVAGEFDMGAFRLAKRASVANVYTIDPSANQCEWMDAVKDKNDLSNLFVVNKYVGGKAGTMFTTGEDSQESVQGETLDALVSQGTVPENVGLIRFTPHEHMGWTVDGIASLVEKSHPVVVTAMHLPADHHITAKKIAHINHMLQNFEEWGYASFSLEGSCALKNLGSERCRNFIHVPIKDDHLQESIYDKLKGMQGVIRLDPSEKDINKMVA